MLSNLPEEMRRRCPFCRGETDCHEVPRTEYPPCAPLAIGLAASYLYVLSRRHRYRCHQCQNVHERHNWNSRFWMLLWFPVVVTIWLLVLGVFGLMTRDLLFRL